MRGLNIPSTKGESTLWQRRILLRRGTDSATLRRSLSQLTALYKSRAASPASQRTDAAKIRICSGFVLAQGSGVKEAATTGFTALSRAEMPLLTAGVGSSMMFSLTVTALGTRLNTLCSRTGSARRNPTSPHRAQRNFFGAFFSSSRASSTAKTSHPAEMLLFKSLRNRLSMLIPPQSDRSSAEAEIPPPVSACCDG